MAVDADPASRELMESTTSLIGDDESLAASTVESDTSADEDVDGPGDADLDDQAADFEGGATQNDKGPGSGIPLALAIGVIMVVGLAALTGWLGFRTYQSHQADAQRSLFLEVGRQGALNLTTINYTEAEADVARILDSATGTFHDDFQKRSQPFIEVVKQAQSKTEGTVTAAGLESVNGDSAQVLVAVSVKTTNAGAPEQQPHAWRMRIDVKKVDDGVKVSNVKFVS
jgi:Mce-associated membrane protein